MAMDLRVPTQDGPGAAKSLSESVQENSFKQAFSATSCASAAKQFGSSVKLVSHVPLGVPTEMKSTEQMYPPSGHSKPIVKMSPSVETSPQTSQGSSEVLRDCDCDTRDVADRLCEPEINDIEALREKESDTPQPEHCATTPSPKKARSHSPPLEAFNGGPNANESTLTSQKCLLRHSSSTTVSESGKWQSGSTANVREMQVTSGVP